MHKTNFDWHCIFYAVFYRIYHDDYHFEKLLFIKPDTPNKDMNILQ